MQSGQSDSESSFPKPEYVVTGVHQFGTWMSVQTRQFTLEDSSPLEVSIVEFPDIVLVLPITPKGVVLIEQFRYPPHCWLIEAPAGRIESGETPELAAARELSEETGLENAEFEPLGTLRIAPHLSSETTHVFTAREFVTGKAHLDRGERIREVFVSFAELPEAVRTGRITDSKTISALALAGLL